MSKHAISPPQSICTTIEASREREEAFAVWWSTPNPRTGHPPSAVLDEYSARAAWFARPDPVPGDTIAKCKAMLVLVDAYAEAPPATAHVARTALRMALHTELDDAARFGWLRDEALSEEQTGTTTPYVVMGQTMRPVGGRELVRAVDLALWANWKSRAAAL